MIYLKAIVSSVPLAFNRAQRFASKWSRPVVQSVQRRFPSFRRTQAAPIRKERIKMLTQNDFGIFFNGEKVLKRSRDNSFIIPCRAIFQDELQLPHEKDFFFIGENEGRKIFGVSYTKSLSEEEYISLPARDALAMTDQKTSRLISRAKHLIGWHRSSYFSGCCGTPTVLSPKEIGKICQGCKKMIFPTFSNFVIVLIEKNGKLLLARSPHFKEGMYSTIAGFVEAGENFEDTVRREVKEEVGVTVKDIRYFGSQSWPFVSSMAAAFTVTCEEDAIQMDPEEIEDAQWFNLENLPELPHPCSISRHIIDEYVRRSQTGEDEYKNPRTAE